MVFADHAHSYGELWRKHITRINRQLFQRVYINKQ